MGEGDERQARFLSRNYDGNIYEWAAYRYNGRWCYGTTGDRLSVVAAQTVNDTTWKAA